MATTTVVARELIGCYLVITLTATGLAKLRNWRAVSSDLHREGVVSAAFVPLVPVIIITAAVTELLLATFLALGVDPVLAGGAATGTFAAFGAYWLLFLGRKNEKTVCACAGMVRTERRTSYTIAGAVLACLLQAALACGWTILEVRSNKHGIDLFTCIALAVPAAILFTGISRQIKNPALPGVTRPQAESANAEKVGSEIMAKA